MSKFIESLSDHQIKPNSGTGLMVELLDFERSSFQENIKTPRKGCLYIFEQGTDLSIISAVFHDLKDDGSLGAPWTVKNPVFQWTPQ